MTPHKLINPETNEVLATHIMSVEDAAQRNVNLKAAGDPCRWESEDAPPITSSPAGKFL